MRRGRPGSMLLYGLGLPALLFLVLPMLVLAFRAAGGLSGSALNTPLVHQAMALTMGTSLATTGLAALLGTPLAYLLARRTFPGKALVEALVELPIVIPPVVAGVVLLLTFGRRGLLGPALEAVGITLPFTPQGVVVAQLFIAAPFYIRGARLGFLTVSRELEEAAAVDGASPWGVLRHVTLPLAFPGLFSGLVLCWARAVGEFGATYLFAGNLPGRTQTMPLAILTAMERDLGAALALTVLLVLLSAAVLAGLRRLLAEQEGAFLNQ